MYVYQQTHVKPALFTVGFFWPNGTWERESDYVTREEAAERVRHLNGGNQSAKINKELLPPFSVLLNIDIYEDEVFQWLRKIMEAVGGDLKELDRRRRKVKTALDKVEMLEAEFELRRFFDLQFYYPSKNGIDPQEEE